MERNDARYATDLAMVWHIEPRSGSKSSYWQQNTVHEKHNGTKEG